MLRKLTLVLPMFLLAGLFVSSGCAGHAVVRGDAYVDAPSMVYIGPGVWVLRDHDAAVFYSDHYYWRYNGGVWYRSRHYHGGWVHVRSRSVPAHVRRIDRPHRYAHYHGHANARVRRVPTPHHRHKAKHHHHKRKHHRHKHH